MTEILIFEKSLQRIGTELKTRYPDVVPVVWHEDDTLTRNGQAVGTTDASPTVGWISFDVMAARLMKQYCQALQRFNSMQWAQTLNAGLDAPVYAKLASQGIRLSKSSAQSLPIAEYTLAYALYHLQGIAERNAQQQQKKWQMKRFAEIANSRWLIAGFGHIGRGIAARARAFEATIVAIRHSDTIDPLADRTVRLSALHNELSEADVVVLACPHTDETDQMANADFFAAMKPGSLFINVARGGLVDEQALLTSLAHDKPAHAVLDVFETEPLPDDNPLWDHPKVCVTSHTSNAGTGTRTRGDAQFLDNLGRFIRNETLLDEVFNVV